MAYIRRRLGAYQVMVRRKGHAPSSKTFRKLADAKAWARKIESEMERGVYLDISKARLTSVSDLLDRFEHEVLVRKKDGAYREKSRLKLLRAGLGSVMLSDLAAYHLKGYERQRERCVGSQAIRHEIGLLRRSLNTGIKEWGIYLPHGNPVCLINLPTIPPGRDRRLQGGEEGKLLHTLRPMPEVHSIVQLALETAMRRGELVGMEWQHIDWTKRTLHIPITKTDTPRTIPLSSRAVGVLQSLPRRIDGRVFGIRADSVTQAFSRACKRAGIEGLRFHDLRHEATSRLFELGLGLMEVASITGHKDLRMLRRYTHLRAEDLVKKLA